jgi:signal transduction histidine kinase/putative methionine-R-sulfoxide reductase with GAF domain
MDPATSRPSPSHSGHARPAREALAVLLIALLTYLLANVLDVGLVFDAVRRHPSRPWAEGVGLAILAAAVTSGILSLLRRRSLALENAAHRDTECALRVRTEQLEALRRVGLELTTQRDPDALLRFIVARAIELVGGEWGGLFLYRPEADVIERAVAVGPYPNVLGTTLRRGEGIAGRIWETGRPLVVPHYQHSERRIRTFDDREPVAMVGAPVVWGDTFLGVLHVVSRRVGAFGEPEAELLSMLAVQAAVAIQSARLLEETQRQSNRLSRLLSVSESLHRGLDLDQVLQQVARGAAHLGFRRAIMNVADPDGDTLTVRAIVGIEGPEREQVWNATYRWADFQVLMQERFRVSRSYLIRHGQVDWEREFAGPVVVPEGTRPGPGHWSPEDALLVPLTGTRGRLVGILSVDEPGDGRVPDLGTIQTLETLANHAGVAIENARLYESARRELEDRERLEEQLIQAQKMEAVGQLAGGVAHDFNNLLTVINGYSDFILRNVDLSERLREDIEEIRRAGERAADLTRQLLAFGRRQMQELRVFSLNDVLREMAEMVRRLIGEDVTLSLALADDLPPIRADRSHITQVLVNLALNARDAMPQGGLLTIETSCAHLDPDAAEGLGAESGYCVLLSIRDTGMGMTPEVRAHLFEPFFSTKGPGKGTGLGLATVYGIVKQSGGEIQVHSEMGRGTEFRIYLPCCHEEGSSITLPEPTELLPRGSETILVVEDDERVRRFTSNLLRRLGYTVLEAQDGIAALEQAAALAGPIDLVVTDVVMPRMGGRDLAARIRAAKPDVPVLFMSGYPGDGVRLTDAGPSDLVPKPFSAEILASRIRRVLDEIRA